MKTLVLRSRLQNIVGLIFVFFVLIIFFRSWQITGLILPLLFIFFFSLATEEKSLNQIIIKRKISRDRIEEKGDLIYVKLSVKNEGKRIPILEIVDEIPDECTVNEGSNHWLFELNQNEKITLTYAIQCHKRGRYVLGPVVVRGSDIFQFKSEIKEHAVYDSITVVPTLIKLRDFPMDSQRLLPEAGSIPSRIYKGRDFDFQGIRDYQEGDELRVINWRVTAKFARLATNEYALDQSTRIFIIFDHTTSTNHVLEEGVRAALSASEFLLARRNKVGFIAIGEYIENIPATVGKRQLMRINEFLIDVECSDPPSDSILKYRLKNQILSSLPSLAQICFITPLYDRIIADFLFELVNQGHNIILIIPQLEETVEEISDIYLDSILANALLSLELANIRSQVAKLDARQIFWYPSGPKYEFIKVRRTK